MKTVENKITNMNIKENDEMKQLSYGDLIKVLINTPKKDGYSIDEIRQRLKIIDQINSNNFNFEDSDFILIKNLVNNFKWGTMHIDIVEFANHINSLK